MAQLKPFERIVGLVMVLGQYRWLAFSALGVIEWAHKDRSLMHHNVVLSVVPKTRLVNVSGFSAVKGCLAHLLLENPICFWESRRQPVWISLSQILKFFVPRNCTVCEQKKAAKCDIWGLSLRLVLKVRACSLIEILNCLFNWVSITLWWVLWGFHSVACFTRSVVVKIPLCHTKQKQILNRK